jgi:PAS domain S-box-containing protein
MSDSKPLRQFLDLLTDAVLVLDRGGRVVFANTQAMRLLRAQADMPLKQAAPVLGDALIGAVSQNLAKGLARFAPRGSAPAATALPSEVVLADGQRFDVAFAPLEGERWALRLAPKLAVATERPAPPAQPTSVAPVGMSGQLVSLFANSPFPSAMLDENFRLLHVNAALCEFTGYGPDQLIGRDLIDLSPDEDRESQRAQRQQMQAAGPRDGPQRLVDRRLIDSSGRERWCRVGWRIWVDDSGRRCYLTTLQDSTAEHLARERADRSVRELDDWFDLSPVGMVLFDEQGLLVRTNPAFEGLADTVPVLLSDADPAVRKLLAWDDGVPVPGLQPGQNPVESQSWVPQRDGSLRHLSSIVRCYRTASGQNRYMAVVEDRSVEEQRDLAQMQIGALMDTAGVGLATFEEASGWTSLGGPSSPNTGESSGSAELQSIRREVVVPESLAEYDKLQHALRHAERAEVRYAIRHPEMGQRWLLTRVEPGTLASGKRTTSVVTLDITEQHLSQQRSEVLLREMTTILESTTAGIAYLRGNLLVRCNRRFERLLGFTAGAMAGASLQELLAGQPDASQLVAEIEAALALGRVHESEMVMDLPGRARQWCSLSVRRRGGPAEPGAVEAIAVLSDITRLKAQQIELEALARDRELMFSLSEVGIAFVRNDRILRANEALCQLTGFDAGQLADVPMAELFASPDEFKRMWTKAGASMQHVGRWLGERQLRHRNGSMIWVQVSKRVVDESDPDAGYIASYVNVDDRHRAQQAVILQAQRTRAILDSVLVGIVTVGADGIEWMNRSARRMFGGDLADFVKLPMSTVATADPDHPFRRTRYLDELIEGQAETFECTVKARDGREFWIVGNAVATGRESTGRQLTYALLDIERRRQAEARIAEAQSSLQRIIEAAPLAITLSDAGSLRVLQANEVAARVAEKSPNEVIGRVPEDIFPPALAAEQRRDMELALASRDVTQREYRITSLGETRVWDARYLPLSSPGLPPDQLLMVATDVTEQRAAQEARFEAAIAQREMLVKEVHHRIKNNLQGVAGLLQQIGARKPEMAAVMSEVVGQVQAIAQVYGLQVGVSGPLRLKSVLEAITSSVQRTFGRSIVMRTEGDAPERWALPEAESIPIALTINELLTNAIKHSASVGDGATAVGCRLVCQDDEVRVVISNRGELPAGFNLARFPGGVSGLGLVRALLPRRSAGLDVEQHGGEVTATVRLVPPGVKRLPPA